MTNIAILFICMFMTMIINLIKTHPEMGTESRNFLRYKCVNYYVIFLSKSNYTLMLAHRLHQLSKILTTLVGPVAFPRYLAR